MIRNFRQPTAGSELPNSNPILGPAGHAAGHQLAFAIAADPIRVVKAVSGHALVSAGFSEQSKATPWCAGGSRNGWMSVKDALQFSSKPIRWLLSGCRSNTGCGRAERRLSTKLHSGPPRHQSKRADQKPG